jgi:hypothetical protein
VGLKNFEEGEWTNKLLGRECGDLELTKNRGKYVKFPVFSGH